MPRPVIIGMNNPYPDPDGRYALAPFPEGCAGHRLYRMLLEAAVMRDPAITLMRKDYMDVFDRRNVLQQRTWSEAEARVAGRALLPTLLGRSVVVLGVATLRALGLPRPAPRPDAADDWCTWDTHHPTPDLLGREQESCADTILYALLPHPSGRCREYNDFAMRRRAGELLLELYDREVRGYVG